MSTIIRLVPANQSDIGLRETFSKVSMLSSVQLREFRFNHALKNSLVDVARSVAERAMNEQDEDAFEDFHNALAFAYDFAFSIPTSHNAEKDVWGVLQDAVFVLEDAMMALETDQIGSELFEEMPSVGAEYVHWLKKLVSKHESSVHLFYNDFLAKRATAEDLAYYFAQETTLDPRFDDILAYIQIGTRGAQKMEIANNYWDEMGRGDPKQVHSAMFAQALSALEIDESYVGTNVLSAAKASGNLSACLAIHRHHYYKSIGYFGVTEYLAPRRFKHVVSAWRRNHLPESGIVYHQLHITIDSVHANGWLNNIVANIIEEDRGAAKEIALGAMFRLNSSRRYLDDLYKVLLQKNPRIKESI